MPFGICVWLTVWCPLDRCALLSSCPRWWTHLPTARGKRHARKASRDGLQVEPPTSAFQSKVSLTDHEKTISECGYYKLRRHLDSDKSCVYVLFYCSFSLFGRRECKNHCSAFFHFYFKGRNIISCSFLAITQWGRRGRLTSSYQDTNYSLLWQLFWISNHTDNK